MNDDRFYEIPGVGRLPSVTTILSVISKPALYKWLSKQGSLKAVNVMDMLKEKSPFIHDAIRTELGEDFFHDGPSIAAQAADYGKRAHAIIEEILKAGDGGYVLADTEPSPVIKAVTSFQEWRHRTEFRVIKTESQVYSKTFGYAGTADAIGETKAGITLLDWKTSKNIYPEYSLQAIAYKYAAEEMASEKIPNVMICRFGKDGDFEDYTVPKMKHPDLFDRFIDAKRLWEWQRQEAA